MLRSLVGSEMCIRDRCQSYSLRFHENGQTYKELITVDKKNNILVYRVPKHNNRPETTFLEDFNNVCIVIYHKYLISNYSINYDLFTKCFNFYNNATLTKIDAWREF